MTQINYFYIKIAILIIVGFAVYSNSLFAPFLFDEYFIITENKAIKTGAIFTEFNIPRYVAMATFGINYSIGKLNPFGYHLVNLIIHLANGILILILVATLLKMREPREPATAGSPDKKYNGIVPFIISLIFVAHPAQTQAVTYIAQRFTLLAVFFVLVSILSYIKFRSAPQEDYRYYLLSLASCILAYKTKENTVALPLVLILMELIFFRRAKSSILKRIMYLAPYFIFISLIVISFIDMHKSLKDVLIQIGEISYETKLITRSQYLLTEFSVMVTYIKLLMLPIHQSIDYYYPLSYSFFEWKTFISFLLLAGIVCVSIVSLKKWGNKNSHVAMMSFGLLWFLIFLLPESSLIPISDVIFEHRMYLPSIGFILALFCALALLDKKIKVYALETVSILAIIILSVMTYQRNELWRDEEKLWNDAAVKYPQKLRAHINLGIAYARKGKCDEAIQELEPAVLIDPADSKARANLALCYWKKGSTDKALQEYQTIIQLDPSSIKGYYDLALFYLESNNVTEAFNVLVKARSVDSTDPMVNALLGSVYCQTGDVNSALSYFQEAIKVEDDNANVYFAIAICLLNSGNLQESRRNFLKALEFNPHYVEAYYFIGLTFENEKNFPQAVSYYQQFISNAPAGHPLRETVLSHLKQLH